MGTLQSNEPTPFTICAIEDVPCFKKRVQKGFVKEDPDPMAFKMLHHEVVDEIGLSNRLGNARYELAVLGHLMNTRAKTSAGSINYKQGFALDLNEGQFAQSIQTTAEDMWARWTGDTSREGIENPNGTRTKSFDAHYKKVQRAYKKLEKDGWINKIRYVNPKWQGIYGTVWELNKRLERSFHLFPDCPPAPPVLIHAETEEEGTYINVVDLIGKRFRSESSAEYNQGECCIAVTERGVYADHDSFCETVAEEQPPHPRHVSVGAFKYEDVKYIDETTPCTVPWVILEPEQGDIIDRYNATCRILEQLDSEGVDLSDVLVTFSGNKSFHIRIPQGMFGNPVFRSVETCDKALNRWAYEHFDEVLDTDLFDPRHLIRCAGSWHEEGTRTTAIGVDEFMGGFESAMQSFINGGDDMQITPRHASPDLFMMTSLINAAESLDSFWIMQYEDAPTIAQSGAFKAAMQGCEEGEQWHEKHQGRNKLIFVAACYLLKKFDEFTAWEEILDVNAKCSPPLSEKEVKTCYQSAQRTIARKNR